MVAKAGALNWLAFSGPMSQLGANSAGRHTAVRCCQTALLGGSGWWPGQLPRQQQQRQQQNQLQRRHFSSTSARRSGADGEVPPPPLLAKLKGDLKAAMKARDAARLSVLRSVLAATLNASKTAQPIRTDAQLVGLLRRSARASQDAAAEFRDAGRGDLADKEEAQVAILESYAQDSGIETVGPQEVQAAAQAVLAEVKKAAMSGAGGVGLAGETIKRLLAPGGLLHGKDVNKAEVAQVVKKLAAQE